MKKTITILIFFLFFSAFYSCKKQESELSIQHNDTVKVNTEKVKTFIIPDYVTFDCFVSSNNISFISPKINGYIKDFKVSPGDIVKKGDLLFTVSNDEIAYKVESIKAKLNSLYTVNREIKILYGIYGKDLKQAQANFELVKKNFQRYKNLLKSESITKIEFDKMKTDFVNSETEVEKAKNMLLVNKLKITRNKHDIESLKKKLAALQTVSNYRFVKAPFNGIVLEKYIDNGNLVSPGVKVLKIGSLKKVAYCSVPSRYKSQLKKNATLFVKNKMVKIVEIYPDISRNSSQFKIKISLPQAGKKFANGEFFTAKYKKGNRKAILIDKKSVKHYNNIFYTLTCTNGYLLKNFITVKEYSNDKYEVLTGLNVGEQLIVNPINFEKNMKCSINQQE